MCVLTIGSFHLFGNKIEKQHNTLLETWFFGISLIWDLSVYFNYSSRITLWRVGDHFLVLEVPEGTCTFLGWGTTSRFFEVSEGTCTELRTYLPTIRSWERRQ